MQPVQQPCSQNVSHVTFSRQEVCQYSYGQGEVKAVYYLTRVRVSCIQTSQGKNVRSCLTHSSSSSSKWKQAEPLPNGMFPDAAFLLQAATPRTVTRASLCIVPGQDEVNIPGNTFWSLNVMDNLPLFLSETQKQFSTSMEVGVQCHSQGWSLLIVFHVDSLGSDSWLVPYRKMWQCGVCQGRCVCSQFPV